MLHLLISPQDAGGACEVTIVVSERGAETARLADELRSAMQAGRHENS
jgi:hypothetical protein